MKKIKTPNSTSQGLEFLIIVYLSFLFAFQQQACKVTQGSLLLRCILGAELAKWDEAPCGHGLHKELTVGNYLRTALCVG